MSFQSFLKNTIVSPIMRKRLSAEGLKARREKFEQKRSQSGGAHIVQYFHQVDDPYSYIAAKALKSLLDRYDIKIDLRIVGKPATAVVPERDMLQSYSRKDAELIAPKYGLDYKDTGAPASERVAKANALLVAAMDGDNQLDLLVQVNDALWLGGSFPQIAEATSSEIEIHLGQSAEMRRKAGHYLGGVFTYGGESYWGIDRLHYLEDRLKSLGLDKTPEAELLYPCPTADEGKLSDAKNLTIDFFVSLRSPYSAITVKRVFDLARKKEASVNVRYVLPMVMRGLPVPREKALYIVHDTAREAQRYNTPFGHMKDPLGAPTERGLSLMPLAEEKGVVEAYLLSFMEGVWADGINAGSDAGLKKIVTRAGLNWEDAKQALARDEWRAVAEKNREDMFALGIWGVPSFKCGRAATWGQDRLWFIEEQL
jgi:2-hydroxychromene-2-carboxylate isomerase